MYFCIVRLLTGIASLSSSSLMRSAPQSRFSWDSRVINATTSLESRGLLEAALALRRQKRRYPARCQRRIVSGLTTSVVSRQYLAKRAVQG